MNTNKLLTYLLYALLTGLVCVVAYKIYQINRDKAKVAQENAEFQQSLRDLGYLDEDSTGSVYGGEETPRTDLTPSGSTVSAEGIEEDAAPAQQTARPKGSTTSPAAKAPAEVAAKQQVSAPAPDRVRDLDNDTGSNDGRYRVVAGSFTRLDGAQREMERIIKMGYHDAEVGRFNRGKYAVVIVKRTNSLNEANRIVDALERKGIDAAVIDRQRKK
ncbi:MAG: SPOR domain-containing protein [Saprospirales bacterium]|nr:SPOR domain-containing protein [Saprospirales bacterium]MBK8923879.1 SPOR domain-containing protein [Saprospirales bacterium]